jgi:NCS1 family nucleobase:cation symporter-1
MSLYSRLDRYLEEHSDDAGPVRGTFSLPRIGMIWLAANLVVTTLLTGTLFVPGVEYGLVVLLIIVGTLIGAAVLVMVGNIGTRTGLPTMALTRGPFGTRGSLLPVAANVIILMGWSWVQAMLAGIALDFLVASVTGFSSPVLFAVVCQTLVVLLATFGHTGIARVEPWLAVAILLIIVYIFVVAFSTISPAQFAGIPADPSLGYTPILVLDVVIATAISWTVLAADFNRFAGSSRAGIIGSGVGYTLSTVISMVVGATALGYVVLSGSEPVAFDPVTIVTPFGAPLAIVIFLSVMATNTMVVYGMVTTIVNAVPGGKKLKFLPTALIVGVISIIGSTFFGLLNQFTTFLVTIGALFAPIFAIMIADYYILKRSSYTADILRPREGRYWYQAGVNWAAVVVWAIGAIAAYGFTYLWPTPIGATIPAFVITFVLYTLLSLRQRSSAGGERSRHLLDEAPADARRA